MNTRILFLLLICYGKFLAVSLRGRRRKRRGEEGKEVSPSRFYPHPSPLVVDNYDVVSEE